MDIKYYWEEFLFWIDDPDNKKKIVVFIAALIGIGLGIMLVVKEQNKGVPQSPEEVAKYLIDESEELKESFSKLEEFNTGGTGKHPVYEVSLYLKKPFLTDSEVSSLLSKYVEVQKVLDKQEGKTLRGIKFTLYDRKILYDKGLTPRGEFAYQWKREEINPDDMFKVDGVDTENIFDASWRLTTEDKGKPDYDKYSLQGSYRQVKPKNGIQPLSDQEFEWYLKFDEYRQIANPVELLLVWDFGAYGKIGSKSAIKRQFKEFEDRLVRMGDQRSFWDYPQGIKKRWVIDYPQLLYYAETGQVAQDDMDARRKLLKLNPNLYTKPIDTWLDSLSVEQVEALNKESSSSGDGSTLEDLFDDTKTKNELEETTKSEDSELNKNEVEDGTVHSQG